MHVTEARTEMHRYKDVRGGIQTHIPKILKHGHFVLLMLHKCRSTFLVYTDKLWAVKTLDSIVQKVKYSWAQGLMSVIPTTEEDKTERSRV